MKITLLLFCFLGFTLYQVNGQVACDKTEIACMMDSMLANYHYKVRTRFVTRQTPKNIYGYGEDQVPTFDPIVVRERLRKLGYEIPMQYNEQVQGFIDLYSLRRREQVSRILGLAPVYFPIFEEALDRAGLPMELKHLAIVESALNPHAISRAGATGIWQFMYYTAKLYNLNINTFVDERRDPYKASRASAEYFRNMYKIYKDWLLVIAAYNCGPGNVNKAIRRSGGKTNFWDISPYLPAETRGYVPAFIAACYVFNYPSEHNLYPVHVEFTYHQDTLHIQNSRVNLRELATAAGVEYQVLKDLNPELKTEFVPYSDDVYVLRVPTEVSTYAISKPSDVFKNTTELPENIAYSEIPSSHSSEFGETKKIVPTTASKSVDVIYHTVKKGEIVGNIAKRYQVTPSQVAKWNHLHNYRINPGQKLKIYPRGSQYRG
jgi:membrane-bound lytic murein transglycosylase D